MTLRLFNTLTRKTQDFIPQDSARVTMYVCGPTVYNYVHIGNARGPVVFGLLSRVLKRIYGAEHVIYARNITDVDDKINAAAAESNVPIDSITQRYAAAYQEDMAKLGADAPDVVPYATQHIAQIIAMCERLIDSGNAYAAEGHVLFNVDSYAAYGQLSGRSVEEMIAGARVEVAPYKKNPADFVLWKPSTPDLPGWESPWGRGRPGWHIECSAMTEAHLGETIDIHAGGNDLMFPHHENEVAQSTCAHGGKIFARYWLHNGMLTFGGKKMSKSLGNTLQVHDLLEQHPPELLRFMLMKGHYRQPLDWSPDTMEQATRTLDGWYGALRDLADVPPQAGADLPDAFFATLLDDLNTPEAFAFVANLVDAARKAKSTEEKKAAKSTLVSVTKFLGLLQQDPESWFQTKRKSSDILEARLSVQGKAFDNYDELLEIRNLIEQRQAARTSKDFQQADEIRNRLASMGVVVEDSSDGPPRWKYANR